MKNLTRNRGDTVELVCEFTGDGNIHAKWFHLGQQWDGDDTRKELTGKELLKKPETSAGSYANEDSTNSEVI